MAVTDQGTSVLEKLKNKAKATGKPFQLYLQLFCQEEFLRRLSLSPYAHNLILKGGLLIYVMSNFESRATIDIDFLLRQLPNDIEHMKHVIDSILHVKTGNDFISLEAGNYETISPQRRYEGISFQLIGRIKNTRTPFNVDIGVGDVIVPKPEKRKVPRQLEDFSEPEINTYSLESTIAEKLDAILQRMELTSRMKDFYDIYYLAHTFDFDGQQLQKAIIETLKNRKTAHNKDSFSMIMQFGNDGDLSQRWRQFIRQLRITGLDFADVLQSINIFLGPVWNGIIDNDKFKQYWSSKKFTWTEKKK